MLGGNGAAFTPETFSPLGRKGRNPKDPDLLAQPSSWPEGAAFLPPRLFEEVLQLALLLLSSATSLVGASLGFFGLVPGYSARGLFRPTLCLVHRPFALILSAALSAHLTLLSLLRPSATLGSRGAGAGGSLLIDGVPVPLRARLNLLVLVVSGGVGGFL